MVTLDSVRKDAPWKWLKDGAADMLAAPVVSLGYGAMFTLIGIAITLGMWAAGLGGFIPVMIGGFALVAPPSRSASTASARRATPARRPGLLDFWKISGSKLTQLGLLSVLLFVFFLAWARLAQFLFAMLAGSDSDFRIATLQNFLFTDPQACCCW
jgi:uncharacterized membrane protein